MKPVQLILAGSLLCILCSCKKDNEPIFSNNYNGSLHLEYSRDFPGFSKTVRMDLTVDKTGVVSFGNGDLESFSGTDTLYDEGDPVLKMQVEGTLEFNSASGRGEVIDNQEYIFVLADSRVYGTMYLWIWDEDNQRWIEPPAGGHEFPFEYQDTYSDGEMQFSVDDAVLTGSSVKLTLPDVEGTFTYGYTLTMSVVL